MNTPVRASTTWPLPWRQALPREARDTLFLLAVVGWTVLPHMGDLPLWCNALTVIVLVWRGLLAVRSAPLPSRWMLAGTLVAALALTLITYRTLLGKEAGITLLVVLVALKTLELRARRDAFVIFFLGFFLVLTHFLTSQSMLVAGAMLVAVWGLLTALMLSHMPVGQPSLRSVSLQSAKLAAMGVPLMVLLFALFPRIGPLWGLPQDAGAKTGLSGTLELGTIAELATDDSVAMTLRVTEGTPPAPSTMYFRGPVLESFDGQQWKVARPGYPLGMGVRAGLETQGAPYEVEITLEPSRLPMLALPDVTTEIVTPLESVRALRRDDLSWVTNRPIAERQRFTVRAAARFRHGPATRELSLQDQLELPPGANPRTLAWAAALRRDARYAEADGRTLAGVLLQHVRTQGYSYTLAPGFYDEDGSGDAIDEFWLDRKEGFCEHFASAFVVVMRALDVPARLVTGYQGAEPNPVDGTLIVRQSHAHAWAEYWQEGVGWVRADPTAAVAPDRIERDARLRPPPGLVAGVFGSVSPGLMLQARQWMDAVNNGWNQWVLNYGRNAQTDLMQRLGFEAPSWEDLALVLVGCLSSLSLGGAGWAWWLHRRTDPWLAAYGRVRQAVRGLGLDAGDSLPPARLARRLLQRHGPAAAEAAQALIDLEALRYGPDAPSGRRPLARSARQLARRAIAALPATPTRPSLPENAPLARS